MSKNKYIKVPQSERKPQAEKCVIFIYPNGNIILGYITKSGNWIYYGDSGEINLPEFWLEEVPDREEEMRETIDLYKECFYQFIPSEKFDEATEFLSTGNNGLAKDLARREK